MLSQLAAVCSAVQQIRQALTQLSGCVAADFVNVIRRFKLLGLNCVRLPFSMEVRPQTTAIIAHHTM